MAQAPQHENRYLMVNPYVYWANWLYIFLIIFCVIAGLVIFIFNQPIGIAVMFSGVLVSIAMMPYVLRNCHQCVLITDKGVTLCRRYLQNNQFNYVAKKKYSMQDVCVTLIGPYRKLSENERCYKAYFCDRYLTPSDLRTRSKRKGSFFLVVNYSRLMCLLPYYNKPVHLYLKKPVTNELVLYRCQCHNYLMDLLATGEEQKRQLNCGDFKDISRRAIVAYSICCLESAMKFYGCKGAGWNVLLNNLWKFTQLDENDTDGINNWFGLIDLLPTSMVRPYDKYLQSHGRLDEEIKLERVSKEEYEQIEAAYDNFHSVIGELCEGIINLAAATTSDVFYDMSYGTLFTLQEFILDVMIRNEVPLPAVERFLAYKHELPVKEKPVYCWGNTFDGAQFSLFLCKEKTT